MNETTEIKIEKNIPVPSLGKWTKTLKIMNNGDSIIAALSDRGLIINTANRNGFRVTTRTIDSEKGDGSCGKLRVWKIDK
jgi:hypothetical protein